MYAAVVMQPLGINPSADGRRGSSPLSERRRRVRHRVHIPAYASVDREASRWALELSVIHDLSEEGMAIQSAFPLLIGEHKNFSLDLSETDTFFKAPGRIVWSDASGRVGIQFDAVDPISLQELKRWLFANAISALARQVEETPETFYEQPSSVQVKFPAEKPHSDYTSLLAGLAAIKKEVETLGVDLDAALHLIARRAHSFTGASGAAIALSEGADMICRATAGTDAPGIGAKVQVGSGFSGECVRTGTTLRCDDSESDPRVDRESCRSLGIRSMMAVPIRREGVVTGLLEVFAPAAHAFAADQESVLRRLSEIISYAVRRVEVCQTQPSLERTVTIDDEFPTETPADLPLPQISQSRNLLFVGFAATLVFVAMWAMGTWNSGKATAVAPERLKPIAQVSVPPVTAGTLEELRKMAEDGDSSAQFAVGAHYAAGEDVPQDYGEAFHWFSLAAEQNHVAAQSALGGFYWAGRGVPIDLVKAYFWSVLAAANGDDGSKQRVALLASRLSRAQILAAQQQADEWLQQHQFAAAH